MWVFPIADKNMIVETGDGNLKEYEFAGKSMTHFVS
jgi:hypothetical protein